MVHNAMGRENFHFSLEGRYDCSTGVLYIGNGISIESLPNSLGTAVTIRDLCVSRYGIALAAVGNNL